MVLTAAAIIVVIYFSVITVKILSLLLGLLLHKCFTFFKCPFLGGCTAFIQHVGLVAPQHVGS